MVRAGQEWIRNEGAIRVRDRFSVGVRFRYRLDYSYHKSMRSGWVAKCSDRRCQGRVWITATIRVCLGAG